MTSAKLKEALGKILDKIKKMDPEELIISLEKHAHGDIARAVNYMQDPNYYDYLECVCGSKDVVETLTPVNVQHPTGPIPVSTFEIKCNACGYIWTPAKETKRVEAYLARVLEIRSEKSAVKQTGIQNGQIE